MNAFDPHAPNVPVAGIDRFALDWTIGNVLLHLGQPRVQFAPDGTVRAGNPIWFLSLGMSPQTLKQLRDITVDAVARYERMHGPIAVPAVSVTPPAAESSSVISLGDLARQLAPDRPVPLRPFDRAAFDRVSARVDAHQRAQDECADRPVGVGGEEPQGEPESQGKEKGSRPAYDDFF